MEALTEVLRELETDAGLNTNGYYYEASDNMFNDIYNLYEAMYNVNRDATISDVMNYINTNTDAYKEGSYDNQSIIDYYTANGYSYSDED